jgi:DNA polymerase III subunit gamma/tau
MITQEYRPKTFKDVAGQKHVVETLKCIAKNPENSPKTIILQGEFGTGKTTCARILARALNCPNAVNGEPCGNCPVCNSDLDISPFYMEYDSAVIGNVDTIRGLRDTFYYNSDKGYRVIVLDECHLISKQAQAALLKVFEETKGRLFFILCTTDAQELLPTIRSRSLELRFNLIPEEDLKKNILGICEKKNITIPEDVLNVIILRSLGHARNAQMLLDRYILLGDSFMASVRTNQDDFVKLFLMCAQSNAIKKALPTAPPENVQNFNNTLDKLKSEIANTIYNLQCNSLVELKSDYEDIVLTLLKVSLGVKQSDNKNIISLSNIIKTSKDSFLYYYRTFTSETIVSSFKSDKMFQAAMWLLYLEL